MQPSGEQQRPMIGRHEASVEVVAPARLHLGFLDLNGGLGRRYGSLGLAIDSFATRLHAERAPGLAAQGPGAGLALDYARSFAEARGLAGGASLRIESAIPAHIGLGSGTQLALAVGTALERLYADPKIERAPDSRAIAETLGRGRRSGIGIGAFDQGGFIVDCGRGDQGESPPVALRIPFPEDWRVLLLLDRRAQGLHGEQELSAFAALPEFPEQTAGRLCRVLLMQVVPGLLERRLGPVAEGIREIQRAVGEHFAPAQGGCFASPAVTAALDWAQGQGLRGSGQSSWGPTGFVLTEDEDQARALEQGLRRRFGEPAPLSYRICAARNRGADVAATRAPTLEAQGQLAPTSMQPRPGC
jgi:beta-ribofuranosylaminobenzene 5'-phosphate synthase